MCSDGRTSPVGKRLRFRFLSAERQVLNGEKALRRLSFCGAARNLSLFYFCLGQYDTVWRIYLCSDERPLTQPLNSAARRQKIALRVSFDPHRLRIGEIFRSCAAGSGTLPGRRGEVFAITSGAFSPVSSNRPDLRGIHADFDCHSISCGPVTSGRQSRRLLRRAGRSKNAKRDAVCLMAFFVSLLQRQGENARREMISYRFIMLHRGDVLSCGVVFLSVFFFQTNGRTCPTTVAVPP